MGCLGGPSVISRALKIELEIKSQNQSEHSRRTGSDVAGSKAGGRGCELWHVGHLWRLEKARN